LVAQFTGAGEGSLCIDADALAGEIGTFVDIDASLADQLESFFAEALVRSVRVTAYDVARTVQTFVHVLAVITNKLITGMTIADVRSRDIGAQLITNSLRTFIYVLTSTIDFEESFIAVALVRPLRVNALGRAR